MLFCGAPSSWQTTIHFRSRTAKLEMPQSCFHILACILLLLAAATPSSASASELVSWRLLHTASSDPNGSPAQPAIRYGHSCESYGADMLVTHGYFFNRDTSVATWLSDTWAMSGRPPFKWRRLLPGLPQEHAHTAYNNASMPRMPCGRFGHATAITGGILYLYGGHDGGTSRHGKNNYEPGFDFEELWALDMDSQNRTWRFLGPPLNAPLGIPGPGKRYLFGMTSLPDMLLVYGGMLEGQGDVWAYHIKEARWEQLSAEVLRADGGPGRRVGLGLLPVSIPGGEQGMLLVGGRWVDGGDTALDGDTWFFSTLSRSWRKLHNVNTPAPPRKYHAAFSVSLPLPDSAGAAGSGSGSMIGSRSRSSGGGGSNSKGNDKQQRHGSGRGKGGAGSNGARSPGDALAVHVIAGGTITTPGLTCTADAWAFTHDCEMTTLSWHRLPDLPTAVYDLRGAAVGQTMFTFGGHLCTASKGDHPFFYVNSVAGLNLTEHFTPAFGCRTAGSSASTFGQREAYATEGEL